MPPRAHLPFVETLVAELAAAPSRDACDRAFLQALARLELGSAASLWRCAEPESQGGAARWRAVRACGAVEHLPAEVRLAACAAAADDVLVPAGVLRVRGPAAQLFLADCRADSAQAELAHALFLVWSSADAALPAGDLEAAALPSAARGGAPTLVELLRARCDGPCLRLEGLPARALSTPLAPGLTQVLDEVLAPLSGDRSASVRVFQSRGPRAGLVLVLESAAPSLARAAPAAVRSRGGAWSAHPTPQGGSRCQVWLPAL
ncbi:MAG: hypothetical protein EPO68_14940 [Planctomycetota bacterium]|nr:MAG: hypothetical protein EPO68_14940 [Planctomycetota bacterium]